MSIQEDSLNVKQAGAIAGVAVFSITIAAACAFTTFLCSYAQGYGFGQGFKRGTVEPESAKGLGGNTKPSTSSGFRSYLKDDEED